MTASSAPGALPALLLLLCGAVANAAPDRSGCEAAAQTRAGPVCGVKCLTGTGTHYASFLGVPYAKQPLGELRFQELQPLDPWTEEFNATKEGPVCPQTDVVYKNLQTHSGGMSEACIHANIHVPWKALPKPSARDQKDNSTGGLPIFVFVHGGGFAFGSGDTDLHGPEYLVSKGAIVITFNYRLNVFGFLSLNSERVPGNNGLRDCVTLLRWVRDNARAFGGDPRDVTLAGQSAGAAMAHLLSLSSAAEGLFKRVVLFSGVGNAEFFSTSPIFAKIAAGLLLGKLGIPAALGPDEVHRRLVAAPLDALMSAHSDLLDLFGLTVFAPVVESPQPGVTPILDEDPDALIERGCGRHIPLMIGFTSAECETFRPRFTEIDIVGKIAVLPALLVPPKLTYQTAPTALPVLVKLIEATYFNETRTLDDFIDYCSDAYYKYPALKLAERRASVGGAPTYLFRFGYGGRRSAVKEALNLDFCGAGHIEDITYVFRAGAVLGPLEGDELGARDEDSKMKDRMTDYIINFMRSSNPTAGKVAGWNAISLPDMQLRDIESPQMLKNRDLTAHQQDIIEFFDGLHRQGD